MIRSVTVQFTWIHSSYLVDNYSKASVFRKFDGQRKGQRHSKFLFLFRCLQQKWAKQNNAPAAVLDKFHCHLTAYLRNIQAPPTFCDRHLSLQFRHHRRFQNKNHCVVGKCKTPKPTQAMYKGSEIPTLAFFFKWPKQIRSIAPRPQSIMVLVGKLSNMNATFLW